MPIYEYRCTSCGRSVDVLHPISESGPTTCEVCGGAMRKALSPPAIHFKGSGWAKKDARSATAKASTGAEASDGPKDGGGATVEKGSDGAGASDGAAGGGSAATTPAPSAPASSSAGDGGSKSAATSTSTSRKGRAGSTADRSA